MLALGYIFTYECLSMLDQTKFRGMAWTQLAIKASHRCAFDYDGSDGNSKQSLWDTACICLSFHLCLWVWLTKLPFWGKAQEHSLHFNVFHNFVCVRQTRSRFSAKAWGHACNFMAFLLCSFQLCSIVYDQITILTNGFGHRLHLKGFSPVFDHGKPNMNS